jgi:hypothetical protein
MGGGRTGRESVGVAACKLPDSGIDKEDRAESRYIESVWIASGLRGNRLGERLIKYMMHVEYRKSRLVRQYLLWVSPLTNLLSDYASVWGLPE